MSWRTLLAFLAGVVVGGLLVPSSGREDAPVSPGAGREPSATEPRLEVRARTPAARPPAASDPQPAPAGETKAAGRTIPTTIEEILREFEAGVDATRREDQRDLGALLEAFKKAGGVHLPSHLTDKIRRERSHLVRTCLAYWAEHDVRRAITESLEDSEGPGAVNPIGPVRELARRGSLDRELVLALLGSEVPEARLAGLRGARKLTPPPVERMRELAVEDLDDKVRETAMSDLVILLQKGLLTASEVAPVVPRALRDPARYVRFAAMDALPYLGAAAYDLMVAELRHPRRGASVGHMRVLLGTARAAIEDVDEGVEPAPHWRRFLLDAVAEGLTAHIRTLAQHELEELASR